MPIIPPVLFKGKSNVRLTSSNFKVKYMSRKNGVKACDSNIS